MADRSVGGPCRRRHVGCLVVSLIAAGCGDPSAESAGSGPTTAPTATTSVRSPPAPLPSADLERYRIELAQLMPEKRVIHSQGAAVAAGRDVVAIQGFDHVLLARRTADGKTEQACAGSVSGAVRFVAGSSRTRETE